MFRIRFILIWIRIWILLQIRSKIGKILFSIKKYIYLLCFVIYGINFYVSLNTSLIVLNKMYDILMILLIYVEIFNDFGWFFAIRIRIRVAKMKRIQTNPDPKHCCLVQDLGQGLEDSLLPVAWKFVNDSFREIVETKVLICVKKLLYKPGMRIRNFFPRILIQLSRKIGPGSGSDLNSKWKIYIHIF